MDREGHPNYVGTPFPTTLTKPKHYQRKIERYKDKITWGDITKTYGRADQQNLQSGKPNLLCLQSTTEKIRTDSRQVKEVTKKPWLTNLSAQEFLSLQI